MRRATPAQQFGAVISERAPETRDLAASLELEKFLRAMGLYENDTGSRRRKVGRVVYLPLPVACVLWLTCDFPDGRKAESGGVKAGRGVCCIDGGRETRE